MLGSVNIQLSPKASPRFVFGFLLAHGLLFLGVEYIIFPSFPLFTLAHALIGIGIYLIFWRAYFPRLFWDVSFAAGVSVLFGVLFGDVILDNYFFMYPEAPTGLIPTAYAGLA